ncbi:glutamine amidotransferase [Candidatus Saccharibacteria bacterium]|nr:glutamine amidotransferase [Candidatus Saccharibacteria bacterium]
MNLRILHLYPKEMNLYGDHGNILALEKRCNWRNIKTEVIPYEPGNEFPQNVDIIFGGGGQDSGQNKIADDLLSHKENIGRLIKNGTPALFICGLYQLMGKEFITAKNEAITGLGIFSMTTKAGNKRLIGNIVIESHPFGQIVGFENHSGCTILDKSMKPLGRVIKGAGNNGKDRTEGVFFHNAIGTYLHGPILPQNPTIADFIIQTAITNKYDQVIAPLDDNYEDMAHRSASKRPR